MSVCITDMQSQPIELFSRKIAIWGGGQLRAHVFGARGLIFMEHRAVADKLLNWSIKPFRRYPGSHTYGMEAAVT
jgi:hypothetical protein